MNVLNLSSQYAHRVVPGCNATVCNHLDLCMQNAYTPLHRAAGGGHVEVVRALLAAGANKEATDRVKYIHGLSGPWLFMHATCAQTLCPYMLPGGWICVSTKCVLHAMYPGWVGGADLTMCCGAHVWG